VHASASHSHQLGDNATALISVQASAQAITIYRIANPTGNWTSNIQINTALAAGGSTLVQATGAALRGDTNLSPASNTGSTTPANVGGTAAVINNATVPTLPPFMALHYLIKT
jgi:hypothetical protein